MTQTIELKKTQPGSTEAVQFTDGMLVTAEDLTAAMRYPLSVIQVLLKAYFGCGIVCGLDLTNPAEAQAAETANGEGNAATGASTAASPAPNFILTVEKGVALGCDGYPIENCGPLKLDLTPDPCRGDDGPRQLFVAIRRVTAAEAAARPCGCSSTGGEPAQQCTRMRDHALVQAFDKLPAEICQVVVPPPKENGGGAKPDPTEWQPGAAAVCKGLKQCGECGCRGEPWVLLGSVMVRKDGMDPIDRSGRRYVKPIACICDTVARDQAPPPAPVPPVVDKTTPVDEGTGKATTK
jgi:hypothetical protein